MLDGRLQGVVALQLDGRRGFPASGGVARGLHPQPVKVALAGDGLDGRVGGGRGGHRTTRSYK